MCTKGKEQDKIGYTVSGAWLKVENQYCIDSPPALLGQLLCVQRRNLIGGVVFCTIRCHLGVDPALQPSTDRNHIPGVTG